VRVRTGATRWERPAELGTPAVPVGVVEGPVQSFRSLAGLRVRSLLVDALVLVRGVVGLTRGSGRGGDGPRDQPMERFSGFWFGFVIEEDPVDVLDVDAAGGLALDEVVASQWSASGRSSRSGVGWERQVAGGDEGTRCRAQLTEQKEAVAYGDR
jgi:hypothetical protein